MTCIVGKGPRCPVLAGGIHFHVRSIEFGVGMATFMQVPIISIQLLARFLQGWDADAGDEPNERSQWFPHTTLLPGLQFSLAGILGKPDEFYAVPAVRFAFEILAFT